LAVIGPIDRHCMKHLLLIDDDPDIRALLTRFLEKQGFRISAAGRGDQALSILTKERIDLALCDHRLPDTDSLELLVRMREQRPGLPVIIITGYSDVRVAVELMRLGAHDYVVKPLYPDDILQRVKEALERGVETRAGNGRADAGTKKPPPPQDEFVEGTGPGAASLRKHIALVSPTEMSVLIGGETGTGKEYVARAIHAASKRANEPFLAIDCGALPKELAGSELFGHVKGAFTGALNDKRGSFELASGGTLFLDEVGNLSYENQVKLLRVLQERRIKRIGGDKEIAVNVRMLAATNEDLRAAVEEGRFREDLYHRLNEFNLMLAPLRQRREDIPMFAEYFLKLACSQLNKQVERFTGSAMNKLHGHHWPGNIRELKNVVKRAVLLSEGPTIGVECLPVDLVAGSLPDPMGGKQINDGGDLKDVAAQAERQAIIQALERNSFNKSRTAEMLNIDRKTLYNKLKSLGIDV
jgi:two-component system, NtrC family, response regulator HydG